MPYRRRYSYRRRYYPRKLTGRGAYTYRKAAPVRRKRRVAARRPVKRRRTATRGTGKYVWDTALAVARRLPFSDLSVPALNLVRSVSGSGAYRTKTNSLISRWVDNGPPMIKNVSYDGGGVCISNREYIGDINSGAGTPTAFTNQVYALNPGIAETFPWLSQIAANFDQYRFKGIIFEYKTLSVDALSSTTVNVGSVILSTDYNVYHDPFTDKVHMENNQFASSGKPSHSIIHPIECAARETPVDKLYVRVNQQTGQSDKRLYDLGNFQIATVGLPAPANSIGELWVSYDVELFKPTMPDIGSPILPFSGAATIAFENGPRSNAIWTSFASNAYFGMGPGASQGVDGGPQLNTLYGNGGLSPIEDNDYKGDLYTNLPTTGDVITTTLDGSHLQPGPIYFITPSPFGSAGPINSFLIRKDSENHQYFFFWRWRNDTGAAFTVPAITPTGGSGVSSWDSSTGATLSAPSAGATSSLISCAYTLLVPAATASSIWCSVAITGGTFPTGSNPYMEMVAVRVY